ncbi:MAG TPA: DegT/DnrJ/EryC1/StrS aminotransferase family protein [Chitinophagales bacterium]|nr:DegT/DnrJ/EryC1/StrS aminotransferase family protein [Chitinophagales bacterium]HNF52524.1 DegT/DnrJ/EryC1/StrS aminotransferase family protein [Chitinophagales bacterium]HNJ02557.1 DegT/DnrJ/EryC1/StrS aminotransferase family protein [Chitinophagales bacterium]HNK12840.1 DegT/DnrJ/EryC1/StrS aminotransferase family protein [Chitinophagales bacterium]HNL58441.1 DegT/DnrJ/EryC1/StrS aminotransferase family protein [Chitinophagales bacterium]
MDVPMIDLKAQYLSIKDEIDEAIQHTLYRADFIQGNAVHELEQNLAAYTGMQHVIGCANGTDALQLAIMALQLPKASKIIVPAFTYIAPVEVITFLGYEVVFCDVNRQDFNTSLSHIKAVFCEDVKAIIVVHLFGQPCVDIENIDAFCKSNNIALIEDNAQSLGAIKNIKRNSIVTTSFFPTKNLGAYGDAGAVFCNDEALARKIRMLASHGQSKKYIHDAVGVNSRLDTLQAAILNVKLKYIDTYNHKRKVNAHYYQQQLSNIKAIELPLITADHIFHQYTIIIKNGKRDELQIFLAQKGIVSTINYPIPAYQQQAYLQDIELKNTGILCASVLSIPVFPELSDTQLSYICEMIKLFFATHE